MLSKKHIPNYLTGLRIAVIPLLVAVYYLPGSMGHYLAAGLFVLAGVSDFLDGYLAREWKVQSAFGRFLDPIADKLLVATILILLVDVRIIHDWHILPAMAILCREVLVSGLREHLAELKVIVPVTKLAKWKTAGQMLAIFLLLLGNTIPIWIGLALLWLSAILTLYTGYAYLRHGLKHFD